MTKKIINIQVPESWEQLSRKQYILICKMQAAGINPFYKRQLLFMQWGGIKPLAHSYTTEDGECFHLFKKGKDAFYLSVEIYAGMLRRLDFLENPLKLNSQLLPVIKLHGAKLYGPSNKLYNLTYNEFVHAEAAFSMLRDNELSNKQRNEYLNRLCAILYRRGNNLSERSPLWRGDKRRPFNDYHYVRQARHWSKAAAWKKTAIFNYYAGAREFMLSKHKRLREKPSANTTHARVNMNEFRRLLNIINQGDITKNKEILHTPIWDVLFMLNALAEQQSKT